MTNLISLNVSGRGEISMKNFTKRLNSSYKLTFESQSCTVPNPTAEAAMAYYNSSNLILIQYSFICLSSKCYSLSKTDCTKMKYDNNAFNLDPIGENH